MKAKYRNLPIKLSLLLNIITVLLFMFGPYDFTNRNRGLLILFLVITNIFMFTGFVYGSQRKIYSYSAARKFPIEKLVKICFWISLCFCIPRFIIYTGFYDFSFARISVGIQNFFKDAAVSAYVNRQNMKNASGIWRYLNYCCVLCGPTMWAYIPLSIYFWKELKFFKKFATVFIWVLYLLQYLLTSTNFGLIYFVFLFIVVSFLKQNKQTNKSKKKVPNKRKQRRVIVIAIIGIILMCWIFSFILGGRIGDGYTHGIRVGNRICRYNEDSVFVKCTPPVLRPLMANITRYFSSAYNALAMAFDVDFRPTFGVGHSWFLLDNVPFSEQLWLRTYNMQIQEKYGYNYYSSWHTAYLWFANDVSLLGVPVLFFFLFAYAGKCWKEFWVNKDILSMLVFIMFAELMCFLSGNNQVFQNYDTMFAFYILLIYKKFGKKWNWAGVVNAI